MGLELLPHVGWTKTGIRIEHPQLIVRWQGQFVGYLSTHEGGPLNFVVHLPESTRHEIADAIGQARGARPIKMSWPPPVDADEAA